MYYYNYIGTGMAEKNIVIKIVCLRLHRTIQYNIKLLSIYLTQQTK